MSDVAGEARIQRALKLSLGVAAGLALVTAAAVLLLRRDEDAQTSPEAVQAGPQLPKAPAVAAPAMPFTDVTAEAGIDFVHRTGAYGERLLPETMGGGVAFFDYDKDGHPDLLFLNSMDWPWQPQPDRPATSRLYRNQGDGTFADVSAATGMDITLYGMGVATGDYDGDGLVDVFVAGVGENRLYRNIGGERFEDATDTAGVASD
ncbi:MAG: VCBS repeat-containing protein, partial [Gammaproteobacteria bacterium]|nr:VCBS repeat-containing protein [Gammaproteobacteria bacterium]